MSNEGKTVNKLSRPDVRKLEDFVNSKKREIEEGKWSKLSLAQEAEKKFRRPITIHNITGAAGVMGIKFRVGDSNGPANLKELKSAVKLLAQDLKNLRGELGVTCSPTIEALAEEQPTEGI